MSFDNAHEYLASHGYGDRIIVLEAASGTVAEAAQALGTQPERIAKSLSFLLDGQPIIIVTKGTARVDNRKYKATFHSKASMISFDEVDAYIGHEPGGVCPFGIKDGVRVYLDCSLREFDTVYPAGGDDHSAVKLTPDELYDVSGADEWVDVCKE